MSGENSNIAAVVLGVEQRLGDKLEEVRVELAGMGGTFTAQHTALDQRITSLEATNIRNGWKDWIKYVVIIPITMLIHKILTAMGIKI